MFQDNLNIKFFQKILRRDNYFAEKANNFVVVKSFLRPCKCKKRPTTDAGRYYTDI